MSRQRVLIDTGAVYAFVTRTDVHHESAKHFVRELLEVPGISPWPTSCSRRCRESSACRKARGRARAGLAADQPQGTSLQLATQL
jgi:hypothetical protein